MIVPVFNYHLSIITIMGKNNKSLYINIRFDALELAARQKG